MTEPTISAHTQAELTVPADGAFAAVLRATAASLAARLDFTLDDIEDLRMAIGEAFAVALETGRPGGQVVCAFDMNPRSVGVSLRVATDGPASVDEDGFAWQVLTTMAHDAAVDSAADSLTVSLTMVSSIPAE